MCTSNERSEACSVCFPCRHLYYGQQFGSIKRMNLDGGDIASEVTISHGTTHLFDISGIAVDHRLNLLYWAENTTSNNVIMYLNMTEWSRAYRLNVNMVSYLLYTVVIQGLFQKFAPGGQLLTNF